LKVYKGKNERREEGRKGGREEGRKGGREEGRKGDVGTRRLRDEVDW
jgi:flagellar biosynthesis/type III secretory pathway protein FliH